MIDYGFARSIQLLIETGTSNEIIYIIPFSDFVMIYNSTHQKCLNCYVHITNNWIIIVNTNCVFCISRFLNTTTEKWKYNKIKEKRQRYDSFNLIRIYTVKDLGTEGCFCRQIYIRKYQEKTLPTNARIKSHAISSVSFYINVA